MRVLSCQTQNSNAPLKMCRGRACPTPDGVRSIQPRDGKPSPYDRLFMVSGCPSPGGHERLHRKGIGCFPRQAHLSLGLLRGSRQAGRGRQVSSACQNLRQRRGEAINRAAAADRQYLGHKLSSLFGQDRGDVHESSAGGADGVSLSPETFCLSQSLGANHVGLGRRGQNSTDAPRRRKNPWSQKH